MRHLAFALACLMPGLPTDEQQPPRVLLLTSGRSWHLRIHGAFSTRETWESARKRLQSARPLRATEAYEFNPPIEVVVDQIWEAP